MEFRQWLLKNGGIALAVILFLAILLLLLGRDISSRTAMIGKQRQDLLLRSQAINSLALLRSEGEKSENIFKAVKDFLPTSDQLISFPNTLENLAKNNQLGFGFAFNAEVPASESEPGVNTFTLTSSGAYNNFLNFLKAVEKGKYYAGFDFIELNKKDKDFQILMKGKVFSQ
ncbi:MAG: hypothetical protein HYY86_02170 [Candidatus Harrisonbacteria bacterium]|nr:hypothetical protein [Candidatus Harrisonbacteria bacterium]